MRPTGVNIVGRLFLKKTLKMEKKWKGGALFFIKKIELTCIQFESQKE